MTLFMMIGPAGAGKSYIAKQFICPIVSSDAIRLELFGDEDDQSHNQEVFNEVHRRIKNHLSNGESCVYDATNLSRKRRIGFLKQLPKDVEKVAIVVATEPDIIYAQNKARDRQVPEEVIQKMLQRMQLPIMKEGWDKISYVPHPNNKKIRDDYLEDTVDYDQENPHHSLCLYGHLTAAASYVLKNIDRYDLSLDEAKLAFEAALFHDIGKPICKTYQLWSGKIDNYAHYYNHAEVGAYLIACTIDNDSANKNIPNFYTNLITIVQHHMDSFADEEWLEKFKNKYGERMAHIMKLVHEADINAH